MTKQFKLIQKTDTKEFEAEYNDALKELESEIVSVSTPDYDGKVWSGIIEYEVSEKEEEVKTFKNMYHQEGEVYLCAQCPYIEWDKRKNVKKCKCPYSVYHKVRKDQECCEYFYNLLANHEIEAVEGRI